MSTSCNNRLTHCLRWLAASFCMALAAQAHVLIYQGTVTETVSGGDTQTRNRYFVYLVVDTTYPDSTSGKVNATVIFYQRSGNTGEFVDLIELDNDWDFFDYVEATGPGGRVYGGLAGRTSYTSDAQHFSTLLLRGAVTPNVYLYDDEGGNPVRDSVVRVIHGAGQSRRLNDLSQEVVVQQSWALRLHGSTRAVNPTGTSGDFTTAIRYVFDHLHISIPAP